MIEYVEFIQIMVMGGFIKSGMAQILLILSTEE
jgi:hypothetical protein